MGVPALLTYAYTALLPVIRRSLGKGYALLTELPRGV
jgi:hypothetical protein